MFSHRIVTVDFYTSAPVKDLDSLYSEFRLSEVARVPVLRIFGSTPKGQKTCAHIHGVFPYITILNDSSIENFERQIAVGIDKAVNDFLGSKFKDHYNRSSTPAHHVFKVVRVIGRTFYGFRSSEETFLRIYFYNPLIIKKVVDLLLSGSILNQTFQPYEAHIPYHLQFMIDYNLYGMNLVHYSNVKFRRKHGLDNIAVAVSPISSLKSSLLSSSGVTKFWDLTQIPESMYSLPSLEKGSVCELEIDVLASDIVVLSATSGVRSCNPGIDAIWQDEMERRRQHNETNWSQISIPESQARPYKREMFPSEAGHRQILDEKLQASKNTVHLNKPLDIKSGEFEGIVPSSQIVTHEPSTMSSATPPSDLDIKEQSEVQEDEFFLLLQEMQREKNDIEREAETTDDKDSERLEDSDNDDDLIDEMDGEKDDMVLEEANIWEQSFLCNTILDEFMAEVQAETTAVQVEEENKVKLLNESTLLSGQKHANSQGTIFQGDGQGEESDSSSNDEEITKTGETRRSMRLSVGVNIENKQNRKALQNSVAQVPVTPETNKSSGRQSPANIKQSVAKRTEIIAKSVSSSAEVFNQPETEKSNAISDLVTATRSSRRIAARRTSTTSCSISEVSSHPHEENIQKQIGKGLAKTISESSINKAVVNKENPAIRKRGLGVKDAVSSNEELITQTAKPGLPIIMLDRLTFGTHTNLMKLTSPRKSKDLEIESAMSSQISTRLRDKGRNISSTSSSIAVGITNTSKQKAKFSVENISEGSRTSPRKAKQDLLSENNVAINQINHKAVNNECSQKIEVSKNADSFTVNQNTTVTDDFDFASKLKVLKEAQEVCDIDTGASLSSNHLQWIPQTCNFAENESMDEDDYLIPSVQDGNVDKSLIVEPIVLKSSKVNLLPEGQEETSVALLILDTTKVDNDLNIETLSQLDTSSLQNCVDTAGCQTEEAESTDVGIRTNVEEIKKAKKDIGIQTEELPFIGPLCRCQCVIQHPLNKNVSTDVQMEFKPKMKNKYLQTEISEIMWKSKKFNNSPIARKAQSSSIPSSINEQHLDPTSPKIRSPTKHGDIPSSTKKSVTSVPALTAAALNTLSPSSLLNVSIHSSSSKKASTPIVHKSFLKQILRRSSKSHGRHGGILSDGEGTKVDLSVDSIYEFSSPLLDKSLTHRQYPRKTGGVSLFEMKRSVSRSKARYRRMQKTAAVLEANCLAPDVFQYEFEPMKQPPSFKSVKRWLKTEENVLKFKESKTVSEHALIKSADSQLELSSDEEVPEDVRRCFGESSSDNEEDHDSWKDSSFAKSKAIQSPLNISIGIIGNKTPVSGASLITPKSILKMDSCRRTGERAKRKIHWEDESFCKRFKPATNVNEARVAQDASKDKKGQQNLHTTSEPPKAVNLSELDGPSPKNNFGFEHDMSNLQDAKALHQHQYLTTWSVEVHCEARNDLIPDPKIDAIVGIFIFISNDVPDTFRKPKQVFKCLLTHQKIPQSSNPNCAYYSNENELLNGFLQLYHEWDPDMLIGYEIEKFSWGYIIDRGVQLGRDMTQLLSRLLPRKKVPYQGKKDGSSWDGMICGRIVLNLWQLLRHEIAVQSYTYENAAYHILHRKVCRFSYRMLADLWNSAENRARVFEYYAERVKGVIEIMETLDLINRTSELARLFGIQFYEVFSRGSQFRVESMMIRTARPSNFIAISPGVNQRARMRAPEFVPLILEPRSNFYTDPVAVLDFQSLYPSMIIAYNYDYATVLGRVEHLGTEGRFELGCLDTEVSSFDLQRLNDHIHISPAGVAFVDASIRKGILPEMLEQILDTRQMVKRAMKKWKNEGATIQKILDSRQLGLKLIANVTYGYTSANFSGRMPCVEIADSVVSKGRETLQRAIDLVKSNHGRWGGDVLYGDTDSLFIRFPGRDRQEAFRIAQEIADEVTQSNPKPVKLKLEKVYQPCILQSKKRYVGYSYESPDQVEPKYDAKGIETVRRDGCPAVKKILEKSLHILFTTNDAMKVQNFVQLQFKKLFTGRVSMKEYTFARQFRGRSGYKPGACVPSLEIAKKATEMDPRAEPLTKERVSYVVIYGKPTLPLIQLVRTPLEFMSDYTMRLNAHYYIEKVIIPALNRCLSHAKMDASKWYKNLPRKYLRNILEENKIGQGTLDDYVQHANCFRCDEKTEKGACLTCDVDIKRTTSFLIQMSSDLGRKLETSRAICEACSGNDDKCINFDCPVLPKLLRYERDEYFNRQLLSKLNQVEWC